MRTHTPLMVEKRGDTILIDGVENGSAVEVHRSVQDLWRAQNAAWRTRVLGQLRQVDELRASSA